MERDVLQHAPDGPAVRVPRLEPARVLLSPSPDPAQLPHLLRLLDDEAPATREAVVAALARWGDALPAALAALPEPPGPLPRRLLQTLLAPTARHRLRNHWTGLQDLPDGSARLEAGLGWIAEFQTWIEYPEPLSAHLDRLAAEARTAVADRDAVALANHLFHQQALIGAQEDYVNPLNSNAVYAIVAGRGLPITLASIYMLVGARLGLDVRGIGAPGHFLALIQVDGEPTLVDCFHGGHILSREHVNSLNPGVPDAFDALLALEADAAAILSRTLANLHRAYAEAGSSEDAELMEELRQRTAVIP